MGKRVRVSAPTSHSFCVQTKCPCCANAFAPIATHIREHQVSESTSTTVGRCDCGISRVMFAFRLMLVNTRSHMLS